MRKVIMLLAATAAALFTFAAAASAHVVVTPGQVAQGSYETFTMRVPTEKEIPTVKVKVTIPDGVDVSRVEPASDWTYVMAKDATGKVTSITWTAQGEGLKPGEFEEFHMQGKVADNATSLVWKAFQTYQDGSVVNWVESEDGDSPASVTKVVPAVPSKDTGGAVAGGSDSRGGTFYMSLAALVLSVIALLATLWRKRA